MAAQRSQTPSAMASPLGDMIHPMCVPQCRQTSSFGPLPGFEWVPGWPPATEGIALGVFSLPVVMASSFPRPRPSMAAQRAGRLYH
jgi:hypothetical protein